MKARQDFELYIDKVTNNITSYKAGDSKKNVRELKFKIGDEIPNDHIKDLLLFLPDYVEVEYKNGNYRSLPNMILPEKVKTIIGPKIEKPKRPKVESRIKKRYTMEELTQILNKKGLNGLKEVAKQFQDEKGNPLTDRSSRRLIAEILKAQTNQK